MTRHAVAPYAERLSYLPGAFDLGVAQTVGAWSARLARIAGVRSHAQRVKALAASMPGLSDIAMLAEAASLRPRLLGEAEMLQPKVFAMVHVAVERHMGLRYHPVQLAGGRALTGWRVVEMATGEGRTITAVLPAVAAALAGTKEGVELTGNRETLARITYQRFFNRYLQLSGMTGTAREVAVSCGQCTGCVLCGCRRTGGSSGATLGADCCRMPPRSGWWWRRGRRISVRPGGRCWWGRSQWRRRRRWPPSLPRGGCRKSC
jgi:hypothetical protein